MPGEVQGYWWFHWPRPPVGIEVDLMWELFLRMAILFVFLTTELDNSAIGGDSPMSRPYGFQIIFVKVMLWFPGHVADGEPFPFHVVHHHRFPGSFPSKANSADELKIPNVSLLGNRLGMDVVLGNRGHQFLDHSDVFPCGIVCDNGGLPTQRTGLVFVREFLEAQNWSHVRKC